jgi:hypothetical protein
VPKAKDKKRIGDTKKGAVIDPKLLGYSSFY